MELTVGIGTVESLWVKLKGQMNNVDVTVVVYYSSPIQDDDVKKYFLRNQETLPSQWLLSLWGTSGCQKSTGSITQLVHLGAEDS